MSGFILNRGKSFAARYKEFESKSDDQNGVQQSKGCSSGKISSIDCKPVKNVPVEVIKDDDDDEIEIDLGLSRTGPVSGINKSETKGKRGKRNVKGEKRSSKSRKCKTADKKPTYLVPKLETNESDRFLVDISDLSDSEGSIFSECNSGDSLEPDLDFTIIETNPTDASGEGRKTEKITLKLKFNGKFNKFTVDYDEVILRHMNGFYKSLGVCKRTHELVITYNDKVLTFNDTAKSLNLTIVDILEAYAKERADPLEKTSKVRVQREPNSIEIKIRNNQDGKHDAPLTIYLVKTEMMRKLMEKYAETVKYHFSDLIFDFDGERLSGEETPDDLDMENGSLIDVRIKSGAKPADGFLIDKID